MKEKVERKNLSGWKIKSTAETIILSVILLNAAGCSIKPEAEVIGKEKKSPEIEYSINYVQFKNKGKEEALEEINLKMQEDELNFEKRIEEALCSWKEWEEFCEKREGGNTEPFNFEMNAETAFYKNYALVKESFYGYEGGAHGFYFQKTFCYDFKNRKQAGIEEISGLKAEEISAVCKKKIVENYYGDFTAAEFEEKYSQWVNDACSVENVKRLKFFAENGKIKVIFDPYEAGPWSFGVIEVEL